ncbi:glycosyltransferase family 2 protein [Variovorax sp. J22P271]|uniref:glycosyltransferase family 2 protein n=1 Tax=Variovorax davisae TaxID=3053515 RepID=UPI0025765070|nr:glycosyltransferase family 2 protein [Variovorax sp. J22P271]MDM0035959.1 glycosyltransferase family 2 protein [Variovorax sp. J22P271]
MHDIPEPTAIENLYVILTDFNGFAQTRQCLAALSRGFGGLPRIIVVDHGTTPEAKQGLAREFPEVTRVEASSALWWAGAINVGIEFAMAAGATCIMLLNNDCYVRRDTLFHLLELSKKNPGVVIAPIQCDLQSGSIESLTIESNFFLGFPSKPGATSAKKAEFEKGLIPAELMGGGRGVMIPVGLFRQIGVFDEAAFPHYWADHDFYLRARAAGIELRVALHALVDVDTARTSMASAVARMSFSQFRESLHSIRSHRSIPHVAPLFKKYYPLRSAYMLGVCLYTLRYLLKYLAGRILLAVKK